MNVKPSDLCLYLVTDQNLIGDRDFASVIAQAVAGGATFLQYREKHLTFEENKPIVKKLKSICSQYQIPFVINDDVDLALALDVDGIHVGQSDMDHHEAREKIGPNKILGISVATVEEALRAKSAGADYIGVGAMFPTATKEDAVKVSTETLKDICMAVDLPVVAIGGINKDNLVVLKQTGVDGIAVVSAILGHWDPAYAAHQLKELWR